AEGLARGLLARRIPDLVDERRRRPTLRDLPPRFSYAGRAEDAERAQRDREDAERPPAPAWVVAQRAEKPVHRREAAIGRLREPAPEHGAHVARDGARPRRRRAEERLRRRRPLPEERLEQRDGERELVRAVVGVAAELLRRHVRGRTRDTPGVIGRRVL